MSRFVAVSILAAMFASTGLRAQQGPPIPYVDDGACPFEGCAYREWTAKALVEMRADRRDSARVVFSVKAGEKVTALTGAVVTIKPARVQFREPTTLKGSGEEFRVIPGQTLFMLTYQGEGFAKVWFNGRLYSDVNTVQFFNGVCEDAPSRCSGKIVEKSQTEWWVKIQNAKGQTGWTRETEKFDGKDAYP